MQAVDTGTTASGGGKPLPLILARELAANLATPMFLMDASGVLVFYNDAAALLIGRAFAELGEVPPRTSVPSWTSRPRTASP